MVQVLRPEGLLVQGTSDLSYSLDRQGPALKGSGELRHSPDPCVFQVLINVYSDNKNLFQRRFFNINRFTRGFPPRNIWIS
jgi:hypothetical protein